MSPNKSELTTPQCATFARPLHKTHSRLNKLQAANIFMSLWIKKYQVGMHKCYVRFNSQLNSAALVPVRLMALQQTVEQSESI